jgi:hypothetical protein
MIAALLNFAKSGASVVTLVNDGLGKWVIEGY